MDSPLTALVLILLGGGLIGLAAWSWAVGDARAAACGVFAALSALGGALALRRKDQP